MNKATAHAGRTTEALDLPARHWKAALLKLPRRLLFKLAPHLTVRARDGIWLRVSRRNGGQIAHPT